MTGTQTANRLHQHMAEMVALEGAIEKALDQLIPEVSGHPEVSAMFRDFQSTVRDQLYALDSRLRALSENHPIPDRTSAVFADGRISDRDRYPVSTALQNLYSLFNEAVIGYSTLQPISHRFRESWVAADEGTAAHLARQHTQNYVRAIQQICCLLHDVVLWELDSEGLECLCTCPSCSLGVCLCAASSQGILSNAWADAVPIAVEDGVYVHPPKKGSAAANAGLRSGDIVLAADGQDTKSYSALQGIVREHKPGEAIQLRVRRGSGELEDVTAMRQ